MDDYGFCPFCGSSHREITVREDVQMSGFRCLDCGMSELFGVYHATVQVRV